MRTGPQVGAAACRSDEALHRADGKRQQCNLALGVVREGAGKGRGQVQVIPDAVVGHAGVGRQQRPQGAQAAVAGVLAQLGAEAPHREERAEPVDFAIDGLLHQALEVREAARLQVLELGVLQPAEAAHVEHRAGERVDQHG